MKVTAVLGLETVVPGRAAVKKTLYEQVPMRAQITDISPNDFLNWDTFTQHKAADPFDDFAWFQVNVGPDRNDPGEVYQVLVATPTAISRIKAEQGRFKGLVVDRFDPDLVRQAMDEYVSRVTATSWEAIREHLCKAMFWEYGELRKTKKRN